MNFVKGVLIGTAVTTAAYIMYNEGMLNKKKMTKQARKMAHKMGINFYFFCNIFLKNVAKSRIY